MLLSEYHLRSPTGRRIRVNIQYTFIKRFVYTFTKLHDRRIPRFYAADGFPVCCLRMPGERVTLPALIDDQYDYRVGGLVR